ncbi:MAG: SMI1/KNR4 family protein [Myxococcales bacterium]|nr:SMI1/KNR4 family protein [Myxococcales bacterium]
MLEGFVHRLKLVVDALMSHPQVRLTHLWIGPGASDHELERLEAAWGDPLPAELAALYRQANGVQLRWVDAAHETHDPARDDRMSFGRAPPALGARRLRLRSPRATDPRRAGGRDTVASITESDDPAHAQAFVLGASARARTRSSTSTAASAIRG